MSARELLELAAKAAGYTTHGYGELVGGEPCLLLKEADFTGMWAPLTDDGDALRLAVKLRIDVIHNDLQDNDGWVMAGPDMDCVEDVDGEGSRPAATRRAIVRAAALQAPGAEHAPTQRTT